MKILDEYITDDCALYNADTVEAIKAIPDDSVGLEVYSPPFSSLYTYSNSNRDLGNCKNDDEFYTHFGFMVDDLYRILMPGRIMVLYTTLKCVYGKTPSPLCSALRRSGFCISNSKRTAACHAWVSLTMWYLCVSQARTPNP